MTGVTVLGYALREYSLGKLIGFDPLRREGGVSIKEKSEYPLYSLLATKTNGVRGKPYSFSRSPYWIS